MTDQHKLRRANAYALLKVDNETPLTPDIVRMMLDKIPPHVDIVEMCVGYPNVLLGSRRVAIYYTTSMPGKGD